MRDSLSRVQRLFDGARNRVIVISAFLGAEALDELLKSVPKAVDKVAVFARWATKDITTGATDWQAWDVASRHGVRFLACPGLHAKIYVADERALVGSANATARGLGIGGISNLELLIPADASQEDVATVLTAVQERSSIAAPIGADAVESSGEGSKVLFWLPQTTPELFIAALKGDRPHTKETRAAFDALKLKEGETSIGSVQRALGRMTAFRIVRHEFEGRPLPMNEEELRDLLAERMDSLVANLPSESIKLLIRWLGRFGKNTHLAPHAEGGRLNLHPGGIVSSFQEH